MKEQSPIVFIVDDNKAMRTSLRLLLESVGIAVMDFGSAREFLAAHNALQPGCLLLDIRMPGLNGLDLALELLVGASQRAQEVIPPRNDLVLVRMPRL